MDTPETKQMVLDLNELARRLRRLPPARVKQLLDELELDDPAEDLEFDSARYELLTLAWLEYEAELHRMRVELLADALIR